MVRIIRLIRGLVYPTKCIFCDRVTEFGKEEYICNDCQDRLVFCSGKPCCKRCGKIQVSLGEKGICYRCATNTSLRYKRAVAALKYDDVSSLGILRYKDGQGETAGKVFAYLMAERMKSELSGTEFDAIVGVAPSVKRNRKRGFDPVGEICRNLSKITGILYLEGVLRKIKKTPKQSGLDYERRVKNLIGSIGLSKSADVTGKRILLVDDVMTTGSTVNECAYVLTRGGAKEVYVLTFATTLREPRTFKNKKSVG